MVSVNTQLSLKEIEDLDKRKVVKRAFSRPEGKNNPRLGYGNSCEFLESGGFVPPPRVT